MVRPRSFQVIYYFDTPTLRKRHQSFSRVNYETQFSNEHNAKQQNLKNELKK